MPCQRSPAVVEKSGRTRERARERESPPRTHVGCQEEEEKEEETQTKARKRKKQNRPLSLWHSGQEEGGRRKEGRRSRNASETEIQNLIPTLHLTDHIIALSHTFRSPSSQQKKARGAGGGGAEMCHAENGAKKPRAEKHFCVFRASLLSVCTRREPL